ncbi:MAG: LysR substrate-binding domain-containing protein [Rhodobacteraceae bacterium]|nr:LysR substrate-binding domain-containing protein [Paracoccaceae bacterium]
MPDLPSLKQLEYFVALAETGSFRRAAQQCGISQPSLSVQLASLENRLGQRLVERSRSGVILTAAGREAHMRARAILEEATALVNRFEAQRTGLVGSIRFGASTTLGPYLLPHVIARLHARHPELRLYIREEAPEALVAGLLAGDFDMILVQLPVRGDVTPIRLFREPLELVAARDHPFTRFERLPRAELAGQTVLALGPAYSLRQQVLDMGLAFLPALYVRSEIKAEDKDVAVIPLEGPRILRSVGLVTRTGSSDEAAPRIARLIQTVAREVFAGVLIIEP